MKCIRPPSDVGVHLGFTCGDCHRSNFSGRRYTCRECEDYDLCSNCYELATVSQHTTEHRMILTRARNLHVGITCFCCGESDFEGRRYKCTECPNYDLCSYCYEHPTHEEQEEIESRISSQIREEIHIHPYRSICRARNISPRRDNTRSISPRVDNTSGSDDSTTWIDPDEELSREIGNMSLEDAVNRELEMEAAQTALSTDIPREKVKAAIIKRFENSKGPYDTTEELINDCLNIQLDDGSLDIDNRGSANEASNRNVTSQQNVASANIPEQDLEEENRRLRQSKLCKICLDNELGIVFIPCGHCTSCVSCAGNLRHCPVCRSNIRITVRTFIS